MGESSIKEAVGFVEVWAGRPSLRPRPCAAGVRESHGSTCFLGDPWRVETTLGLLVGGSVAGANKSRDYGRLVLPKLCSPATGWLGVPLHAQALLYADLAKGFLRGGKNPFRAPAMALADLGFFVFVALFPPLFAMRSRTSPEVPKGIGGGNGNRAENTLGPAWWKDCVLQGLG